MPEVDRADCISPQCFHIVNGSGIGHGGPEASASGVLSGTSETRHRKPAAPDRLPGQWRPPFTAERCFRIALISAMGRARVDQTLIGRGEVSQRDLGVFQSNDGFFYDGRTATRDHKDRERSGVERSERLENGGSGLNGFGSGRGGVRRENNGSRGLDSQARPTMRRCLQDCCQTWASREAAMVCAAFRWRRRTRADKNRDRRGLHRCAERAAHSCTLRGEGAFDGGVL